MYFYERIRRVISNHFAMTHLFNLETLQFATKIKENYTSVLSCKLNC